MGFNLRPKYEENSIFLSYSICLLNLERKVKANGLMACLNEPIVK